MEAELIREARLKQLRMTQAELGAELGLTQSMISQVERGRAPLSPSAERRLRRLMAGASEGGSEAGESIRLIGNGNDAKGDRVDLGPFGIEVWRRPVESGDFSLWHGFADGSILLCCGDMAGHGGRLYPAAREVRGWLKGYFSKSVEIPRLVDCALALSRFLLNEDLEMSLFIVMARSARKVCQYEALSCGYPPPLLLLGPPFETKLGAVVNSALPVSAGDGGSMETVTWNRLDRPWSLVVASDGLLGRLGNSENEGRRRLLAWRRGERRAQPLEECMKTKAPLVDDESCALVSWAPGWDLTLECGSGEFEEQKRYILRVVARLPSEAVFPVRQSLTEAFNNVCRHAYAANGGFVIARFREEQAGFRIVVEDGGRGGIGRKDIECSTGGFRVITELSAHLDVSRRQGGGSVVTLWFTKV